jgi:hypothetical protein
MIFFGEESLRTAIQNFVAHYHSERNHQGLANQLISPEPGHLGNAGEVQRRGRLGGMLHYYYRGRRLTPRSRDRSHAGISHERLARRRYSAVSTILASAA